MLKSTLLGLQVFDCFPWDIFGLSNCSELINLTFPNLIPVILLCPILSNQQQLQFIQESCMRIDEEDKRNISIKVKECLEEQKGCVFGSVRPLLYSTNVEKRKNAKNAEELYSKILGKDKHGLTPGEMVSAVHRVLDVLCSNDGDDESQYSDKCNAAKQFIASFDQSRDVSISLASLNGVEIVLHLSFLAHRVRQDGSRMRVLQTADQLLSWFGEEKIFEMVGILRVWIYLVLHLIQQGVDKNDSSVVESGCKVIRRVFELNQRSLNERRLISQHYLICFAVIMSIDKRAFSGTELISAQEFLQGIQKQTKSENAVICSKGYSQCFLQDLEYLGQVQSPLVFC